MSDSAGASPLPTTGPSANASAGRAGPSSEQRQQQSQQPPKPVYAADVKNKSCWICSEDEDEDYGADSLAPEASPAHAAAARAKGGKRRFVHACGCTLVAHEAVSGLAVLS